MARSGDLRGRELTSKKNGTASRMRRVFAEEPGAARSSQFGGLDDILGLSNVVKWVIGRLNEASRALDPVVVHVGRLWLRTMDSQTHACPREHTIALQKGTFSVSKPICGNRIQNRR